MFQKLATVSVARTHRTNPPPTHTYTFLTSSTQSWRWFTVQMSRSLPLVTTSLARASWLLGSHTASVRLMKRSSRLSSVCLSVPRQILSCSSVHCSCLFGIVQIAIFPDLPESTVTRGTDNHSSWNTDDFGIKTLKHAVPVATWNLMYVSIIQLFIGACDLRSRCNRCIYL